MAFQVSQALANAALSDLVNFVLERYPERRSAACLHGVVPVAIELLGGPKAGENPIPDAYKFFGDHAELQQECARLRSQVEADAEPGVWVVKWPISKLYYNGNSLGFISDTRGSEAKRYTKRADAEVDASRLGARVIRLVPKASK